jgi:rfaE bifunctional protein nucleotidyltransferase chain/domain
VPFEIVVLNNHITTSADLGSLRGRFPGQTIVLATGCFDLLHTGHLHFLEEARRQGDVLVVGLNSDGAVRNIKGAGRPILRQEERAALVAAFRCVDLAFIFDDTVADGSILILRPDVFVIGEESVKVYPSELSTARTVGARVHVVSRVGGTSTTSIVVSVNQNAI